MRYVFLLLILPSAAFAAWDDYLSQDEYLDVPTEEILIKKPEKFLRNETMIYDLNTDLGIRDQRKYTGTDRNRFSLSGHLSADYEHLSDILGVDVTYLRRSERYDRIWWGAHFFRHSTAFDAVADQQTDEALGRPGNQKETITGVGLGLSYRFKLMLGFWETENVFENIDVFVNYLRFDETFVDKTYQGYGLTTSYGLIKRSSTNFYYGPKISYNFAPVKREKLDASETSRRSRELTLGWLSLAFELGFFY